MSDINFYLPSFTKNLSINLALVESWRMHQECFYDDIRFASFYGSFPNAIWNGGRCEFGKVDLSKFHDIVNTVNSLGIAIRYTFTNCLIKEEHLSDDYCNRLMEMCNNGFNEVLINSAILENYLRANYPNYKFILSTTTLTRGADSINKACNKYDLVVPDYRDAINIHFLEEIIRRDKIEILLNESCVIDCQYRQQHYSEISRAQLYSNKTDVVTKCMYNDLSKYREAYISNNMLYNLLVPMGYMNYKIRGRELNMHKLLNEYYTYLVKPKYKQVVDNDLKLIASRLNY